MYLTLYLTLYPYLFSSCTCRFKFIVFLVLTKVWMILISCEKKKIALYNFGIQHTVKQYTVCPRSLDPFYIVTYYTKWVKTSRTHISHMSPGCSVGRPGYFASPLKTFSLPTIYHLRYKQIIDNRPGELKVTRKFFFKP